MLIYSYFFSIIYDILLVLNILFSHINEISVDMRYVELYFYIISVNEI